MSTTTPSVELNAAKLASPPESLMHYIHRYGGFCRDCADNDGVCPLSGIPCRDGSKAIRHVLSAIGYGLTYGYIDPRTLEADCHD